MSLRPLVLIALLPLAGCGQNVNVWAPKTWFGYGETPEDTQVEPDEAQDPRPLVDSVTFASIEQANGGVIVRATGLPPTQGYWNAELVAQPVDDKGKLVLEFHLVAPAPGAPVINQRSREITVAYDVTAYQLRTITSIEVRSASNSMTKKP